MGDLFNEENKIWSYFVVKPKDGLKQTEVYKNSAVLKSVSEMFSDIHYYIRKKDSHFGFCICDNRHTRLYHEKENQVFRVKSHLKNYENLLYIKGFNDFKSALFFGLNDFNDSLCTWDGWLKIMFSFLEVFNWKNSEIQGHKKSLTLLTGTLKNFHLHSPQKAVPPFLEWYSQQKSKKNHEFQMRFGKLCSFLWESFVFDKNLHLEDLYKNGFPSLKKTPDHLLPAHYACTWPVPLGVSCLARSLTTLFFMSLKKVQEHIKDPNQTFQIPIHEKIGMRSFQVNLYESKKEIVNRCIFLSVPIFEENGMTKKIVQSSIEKSITLHEIKEHMGEIQEVDFVQLTPIGFSRGLNHEESKIFSVYENTHAGTGVGRGAQSEEATTANTSARMGNKVSQPLAERAAYLSTQEHTPVYFNENRQTGMGFLRPLTVLQKNIPINIKILGCTLESILFSETEKNKDYYIFKLYKPKDLLIWVSSPTHQRGEQILDRSFFLEGVFS